jgi:hypothetical protein
VSPTFCRSHPATPSGSKSPRQNIHSNVRICVRLHESFRRLDLKSRARPRKQVIRRWVMCSKMKTDLWKRKISSPPTRRPVASSSPSLSSACGRNSLPFLNSSKVLRSRKLFGPVRLERRIVPVTHYESGWQAHTIHCRGRSAAIRRPMM